MYVSLKEYVDSKLVAIEKSTALVKEALDHRLTETNRVREQLREQAGTFVTRVEHDRLVDDINELKQYRASLEGKASQFSFYVTFLIALLGLLIAMASMILKLHG